MGLERQAACPPSGRCLLRLKCGQRLAVKGASLASLDSSALTGRQRQARQRPTDGMGKPKSHLSPVAIPCRHTLPKAHRHSRKDAPAALPKIIFKAEEEKPRTSAQSPCRSSSRLRARRKESASAAQSGAKKPRRAQLRLFRRKRLNSPALCEA